MSLQISMLRQAFGIELEPRSPVICRTRWASLADWVWQEILLTAAVSEDSKCPARPRERRVTVSQDHQAAAVGEMGSLLFEQV